MKQNVGLHTTRNISRERALARHGQPGEKCLHYVRRLIEFRFPGSDPDWPMLNASDIVSFLSGQARHGQSAVKTGASAIRSLLRFLVLEGILRPGLEAAVPPQPRWRLSGLPRFLTVEQVEHVLNVCRESPSNSVRNIAVLLLLARLGLRGDEVAHLQFRGRELARRSDPDPIPEISLESGNCTASCRSGCRARESTCANRRPSSTSRVRYSCTATAPFSPLRNTGVGYIARRLLNTAGISITRPGAHVFSPFSGDANDSSRRCSAGSGGGAPVTWISETTALYAKLDLSTPCGRCTALARR